MSESLGVLQFPLDMSWEVPLYVPLLEVLLHVVATTYM